MTITVADLNEKAGTEPITMLTAYDAPSAAIVDDAGVDIVLVGDSMGTEVLGYDSTLPVTFEEVASRTGAVARTVTNAMVIADMPFLSFGIDDASSIRNAGQLLKAEGAHGIKLESGPHTIDLTRKLVDLGIPTMAHLGLTPQHVNQLSGYVRQGTDMDTAANIVDLAEEHASAGAFSLVLEHVPANLAAHITETVEIPTIGIGAGPDTDGQVLVFTDVVGLADRIPPFARRFANVRNVMKQAVSEYKHAVETGTFPDEAHSVEISDIDDLV